MEVNELELKIEGFLEIEDLYKLKIAEILNSRRQEHSSIELLVELLGVSKFKITKYIQEMFEDLATLGENIDIKKINKGELSGINVPTKVVRLLRVKYVNRSKIFLLFNDMLLGRVTLGQFSQKNYVSRSKTYEVRNRLASLLKGFSIKIQDGAFVGDEGQLRKIAYEVYYYYFNGADIFFPKPIMELKKKIKNNLEKNFDLNLVLTKEIKIDLFLSILSIRISRKNYLNNHSLVVLKDSGISGSYLKKEDTIYKMFSGFNVSLKEEALNELDFILLFLICEGCISNEGKVIERELNNEIKKISKELTKEVLLGIEFDDMVTKEQKIKLKKKINESFTLIHFQRYYSFHSILTFNTDQQIYYFKEAYPQYHNLVRNFLKDNRVSKGLKLDDLDQASLYYDYMFALISIIPKKKLRDKVYICVDFSRGDTYTEYIAENIRAFKHLNIIIQKKIDLNTQLFISDFIIENKNLKQIIWKNPPMDNDWASLGDAIVSIKGGN